MINTRFKKKFNTAVPPPNNMDIKALNDPRSILMFPFKITQTESNKDIKVPTFCFKNSNIPFTLNTSAILV